LVLFQIDLGTTPNIAPPSNLKKPVSMVYRFMPPNPLKGEFSNLTVVQMSYIKKQ